MKSGGFVATGEDGDFTAFFGKGAGKEFGDGSFASASHGDVSDTNGMGAEVGLFFPVFAEEVEASFYEGFKEVRETL